LGGGSKGLFGGIGPAARGFLAQQGAVGLRTAEGGDEVGHHRLLDLVAPLGVELGQLEAGAGQPGVSAGGAMGAHDLLKQSACVKASPCRSHAEVEVARAPRADDHPADLVEPGEVVGDLGDRFAGACLAQRGEQDRSMESGVVQGAVEQQVAFAWPGGFLDAAHQSRLNPREQPTEGGQVTVGALITNRSGRTIRGPLQLTVKQVSSPIMSLANPDGQTSKGLDYLDLTGYLDDLHFRPGQSIFVSPTFNNAARCHFEFELGVYGVLGADNDDAWPWYWA